MYFPFKKFLGRQKLNAYVGLQLRPLLNVALCLNMATSATADQAQAIIDDKSLVEEVIYYFY